MPREIPILRVTHGESSGDWRLVPDGHLRPSVENASLHAAEDVFRMWNADVESIICQEFPSSGLSPSANERKNFISIAKENSPPKPFGLGICADQSSERVLNGLSPKKRGVLTVNSGLCNSSEVTPKRFRQYEASLPKKKYAQPMFQTASMKPVQVSSSAMQKAKALLDFDEIGPCTTKRNEKISLSSSPHTVTSAKRELAGDFKRQSHNDIAGVLQQSARVSACLFQTATGKSVSISNAGMHRAMSLFGDTEASVHGGTSKQVSTATMERRPSLDQHLTRNMPQATLEQPILMLRTAVSHEAKPLEKENLSFSLESPSFSISDRFASGQCCAKVSMGLFQTASGKAVSISNAGMHRAAALLGDTEPSKVDVNPGIDMFQTAKGQSVSVSSTEMKQAVKLLGEDNFSFHVEAPLSSPPIRFVTGKGRSVSVSESAMKRAQDLLGGDLDDTDITMSAHPTNGTELNSQRLFATAKGHLIKVSSGSIQRARVLLKDTALKSNSSPHVPPCHDHAVQEPKFSSLNRRGALSKKFVPCFKAPRRLQPATLPAPISHLEEGCAQSSKPDFLQLVNTSPLHHSKEKKKISYKDYFKLPPHQEKELGHLIRKEIMTMTSETAKTFTFSSAIHGLESIGADEFRSMLLEDGANAQFVTKEWVDNHFRWIVWKLASLERSYPSKVGNRLLTIQAVFDQLRNRYEREVDHAHRSALKKITEGDEAPGRMMVLCVAAVSFMDHAQTNLVDGCSNQLFKDCLQVQIEVTDGWYSLMAHLDQPLEKQFSAGKIFTGQKLRVCRAALTGCTTPMPPLEAFQVTKLALHMNGTYRAHWMDKLGFCKGMPMPLSFQCIKSDGGLVPRTILGIQRIYPVLYFERLPNQCSITRSARAEDLAVRGYHDRRNQVAEEAVIGMEREIFPLLPEHDGEEGAKLFQLLENSAEPELLMADMSSTQHAAFAAYQAKREAARQSLTHKKVLQALGEVHLDSRDVTPFIKLSVTGLHFAGKQAGEGQTRGRSTRGGIVTIWQVTDEQVNILKEGAVFCVSDLYPLFGRSNHQSRNSTLHLRATKTTKWQLLPQARFSCFTPRKALQVSSLGTLPFRSEFDAAVLVVHVGKPYACGIRRSQWLFVSDGSLEEEYSNGSRKLVSLLAIDWSAVSEAFMPVERSLEGCIIGYCNLIKRCRDQRNGMWVAEASESSVFSSNLSSGNFSHLKAAAEGVSKWAKLSEKSIKELEERIQAALVGGC